MTVFKIMNRIGNRPVQGRADLLHNLLIIILHSPVDPVQHHAHKPIFVKFRNERFLLFRYIYSPTKYMLEISLKKLLLSKPIDKITINDLTSDCGYL